MRLLMLGDSHLAQLDESHLSQLERELDGEVDSAAVGGSWSGDLRGQVGSRDLASYDLVLLSVGTNDTHPGYPSSTLRLRSNLLAVLAHVPRAALLLSPGIQQAPAPFDTAWLNNAIREYTADAA